MLHFAYGANMSRAVMRRYAPSAQAIGVAALANHRFLITTDGYASVLPAQAQTVHGVLWRLTARDRTGLDAWENVPGGSYRPATLPVRRAGRRQTALVYLARPCGSGRPRSGYMELVTAAAEEWKLPAAYVAVLRQWVPAHQIDPAAHQFAEFGWT